MRICGQDTSIPGGSKLPTVHQTDLGPFRRRFESFMKPWWVHVLCGVLGSDGGCFCPSSVLTCASLGKLSSRSSPRGAAARTEKVFPVRLGRRSCKGLDSKYFQACGPYGLFHNFSAVVAQKQPQTWTASVAVSP